eukprot:1142174-Pelagomonas_calceolata.AAC.8
MPLQEPELQQLFGAPRRPNRREKYCEGRCEHKQPPCICSSSHISLHSACCTHGFVGLLLAVRLLPQGGDAAIHKVIDALGWRFITRLLLPLSPSTAAALPSAPGTTSASQQQQVELTCGLGLSILSAACRLPDLAASPQVASLVPMLVGVAVQGGVGPRLGLRPCAASPPLTTVTAAATTAAAAAAAAAGAAQSKLGQTSPPAAADAAGQAADAAAVSEALESLVAIGYAAGLEGRAVLLEGGALAAGCAELERVAWAGRQGKVQQREQVLERGVGSVWHRGVLAARLVGLLLGGEQQGQPGMQGGSHSGVGARILVVGL